MLIVSCANKSKPSVDGVQPYLHCVSTAMKKNKHSDLGGELANRLETDRRQSA